MSVAPKSFLQRSLPPQGGPLESFLSSLPLKTSITFPSRGEAATTPSWGLLNTSRAYCSCQGDAEGEPGSPLSCAAALAASGAGDPLMLLCIRCHLRPHAVDPILRQRRGRPETELTVAGHMPHTHGVTSAQSRASTPAVCARCQESTLSPRWSLAAQAMGTRLLHGA